MEPGDGPSQQELAAAGGRGTPPTVKKQRVETVAHHVLEVHDRLAKARDEARAAQQAADAAVAASGAGRGGGGGDSQESYCSADFASLDAQTTAQMVERANTHIDVALQHTLQSCSTAANRAKRAAEAAVAPAGEPAEEHAPAAAAPVVSAEEESAEEAKEAASCADQHEVIDLITSSEETSNDEEAVAEEGIALDTPSDGSGGEAEATPEGSTAEGSTAEEDSCSWSDRHSSQDFSGTEQCEGGANGPASY